MNTFGLNKQVDAFWLGGVSFVVIQILVVKYYTLDLVRTVKSDIYATTAKLFNLER